MAAHIEEPGGGDSRSGAPGTQGHANCRPTAHPVPVLSLTWEGNLGMFLLNFSKTKESSHVCPMSKGIRRDSWPQLPHATLTCGRSPLDAADWAAPREATSSPGAAAPTTGPPGGTPSSRLVRGPFFVDCILICWGLEFMGELLVVCSSCGSQRVGLRPGLRPGLGPGLWHLFSSPPHAPNPPLMPHLAAPGQGHGRKWRGILVPILCPGRWPQRPLCHRPQLGPRPPRRWAKVS